MPIHDQDNLTKFLNFATKAISACQLYTPKKKKPQLRNCLHQVGGASSWLLMDAEMARPLWAVPPLGKWVWAVY